MIPKKLDLDVKKFYTGTLPIISGNVKPYKRPRLPRYDSKASCILGKIEKFRQQKKNLGRGQEPCPQCRMVLMAIVTKIIRLDVNLKCSSIILDCMNYAVLCK